MKSLPCLKKDLKKQTGDFSSLVSIYSLQLKLPVISGSYCAFSWTIFSWIMAYSVFFYPDIYRSNYSREVNKTPWVNLTLLNRSEGVSVLSQVQVSYLVLTLRCEQERLLLWTHALESPLLLLSHRALPWWPKEHTNLELMTSLLDHAPGTQDPGIPFPNDPEPFSRACTGLFSGSGARVDSTARIPTPSPVHGHRQLLGESGKRWVELPCARLGCPHMPCGTRPPQYRMKLRREGGLEGCKRTTLSGRILNLALPSNHESTFVNTER